MDEYVKIRLDRFQELEKTKREFDDYLKENGVNIYGGYFYTTILTTDEGVVKLANKVNELAVENSKIKALMEETNNKTLWQLIKWKLKRK